MVCIQIYLALLTTSHPQCWPMLSLLPELGHKFFSYIHERGGLSLCPSTAYTHFLTQLLSYAFILLQVDIWYNIEILEVLIVQKTVDKFIRFYIFAKSWGLWRYCKWWLQTLMAATGLDSFTNILAVFHLSDSWIRVRLISNYREGWSQVLRNQNLY